LNELAFSRLLSIASVVATAVLIFHTQRSGARLAEEKRKAELTERLKTEVVTTMGRELGASLHSIIGMSELLTAGCRPDQRIPLSKLRYGSRQLLGTIDNAIQMATINERVLKSEKINIAVLAREAVVAASSAAEDAGVAVELAVPESPAWSARGDIQAVRQIFDGMIANAITSNRPGGTVLLTTNATPVCVTVTVESPVPGPESPPFDTLNTANSRHILGRYLAQMMGGSLTFGVSSACAWAELRLTTTVEAGLGAFAVLLQE
jgi:signal transduction histidine kinase